ncbi:MAG TPA: ABC transporter permease [Candidatus Dormibacteraeota bacterium]|nr:ABC transporter permease [Candidatus Dormibacteraeota bacterium]
MSDSGAVLSPAPIAPVPVAEIAPRRSWLEFDWGEIWRYRELLYFLVWRDLKVRYKQTVVGVGWAILQPFMTMVVFTLFFGKLAKIPSNGIPYPIFYYAGLLPWMYFSNAVTSTTSVMVQNQRVITKVYFPRLILPLASVVSGLVDFAISFIVLIGMLVYYRVEPRVGLLLVPALLLLAVATALGTGLWLSALNAVYRDVRYVIPFLMQFWMFASPVVYPSNLVPARWRWLYDLNPMSGVIDGFRWGITGHGEVNGFYLLISCAAVLVLLLGGLVYFHRMEDIFADVV